MFAVLSVRRSHKNKKRYMKRGDKLRFESGMCERSNLTQCVKDLFVKNKSYDVSTSTQA